MLFSSKRPGFTFVELLVTGVITGILATITFVGLSRERSRTSIRRAAEQIQVDIQGTQIRAQSALVLPQGQLLCHKIRTTGEPDPQVGKPCANAANDCRQTGDPQSLNSTCSAQPPVSYGNVFSRGAPTTYLSFADVNIDGSLSVHPNRYRDSVTAESTQIISLPAGTQIVGIYDAIGITNHGRVDLTFDVPTGKVTLNFTAGSVPLNCLVASPPAACTQATIIIRNTNLNLCYSVVVNAAALGTVNRRALVTCP